jgi:hypothetical protein
LDELEAQARVYARKTLRSSQGEDFQGAIDGLNWWISRMENAPHNLAGDSPKGLPNLESRVATLEGVRAPGSATEKSAGEGDRMQDLEKRIKRVEAGGTDEGFELDEHAYPTYSDFADFVIRDKLPSSGLYWDLFSVLVNMRPKGLSGKERADEQHSAERIKTTTLGNNLLAAMSHSRPACLYAKGGVGAPGRRFRSLYLLLTMDQWNWARCTILLL